MQVLVMVKANPESESGAMPTTEMLTEMGKFNQRLADAGVMLAANGLLPSSRGARVRFDEEPVVIDGPFTETKELVAGYWVWHVKSMAEAIDWLKQAPFGGGAEVEIRPIASAEDFGEVLTPELREQQDHMAKQIGQA